jgi:O-methyltransferase involved in polyketide biosynthesis
LHLARNYPQADVVEIDLPSVIAEKKRRLKSGGIAVPPNLRWIEANLGETNLADVLDGRKADLITSEGLTLYLTEHEQARFFTQVETNLADDGIFIGEVYFLDKFQEIRRSANINAVASFIFRMVGNVPGVIPNKEVCRQRLSAAGLGNFEEYPVVDLMDELGQQKPVDVISVIVARKTKSQSTLAQPVESAADAAATVTKPTRIDDIAANMSSDVPPNPPKADDTKQ